MLLESVLEFKKVKNKNFRFFILGAIPDEIESQVIELVSSDRRISYLGWANAETLSDYLCACDVYVQPGIHQSATMQMSLCCRCAVILHDFKSHRDIYCDNGWLLKNIGDLNEVFVSLDECIEQLTPMKDNSYHFAIANLDYRRLARRVLM
jgi:glycosyltransferase involved in cell wall biosynthesis